MKNCWKYTRNNTCYTQGLSNDTHRDMKFWWHPSVVWSPHSVEKGVYVNSYLKRKYKKGKI